MRVRDVPRSPSDYPAKCQREHALRAIGLGAYDYFNKPIQIDELNVVLRRAVYVHELERENRPAPEKLAANAILSQRKSSDFVRRCKLVFKGDYKDYLTLPRSSDTIWRCDGFRISQSCELAVLGVSLLCGLGLPMTGIGSPLLGWLFIGIATLWGVWALWASDPVKCMEAAEEAYRQSRDRKPWMFHPVPLSNASNFTRLPACLRMLNPHGRFRISYPGTSWISVVDAVNEYTTSDVKLRRTWTRRLSSRRMQCVLWIHPLRYAMECTPQVVVRGDGLVPRNPEAPGNHEEGDPTDECGEKRFRTDVHRNVA